MSSKLILVAEDNPDDAFIFEMRFKRAALPYKLEIVADGQQVIDWLAGNERFGDRTQHPLPEQVVLDLKMPIVTGFEALKWIRSQESFQDLPVIILSSSDDPKDLRRALELGATKYFVKSPHLADLMGYLRNNGINRVTDP
ncbi:MAG TPA: response regulator [Candidatus Saccharimonadales bacterium]|nr:response regulator [Candidatus Saccharimonadales bacterium]